MSKIKKSQSRCKCALSTFEYADDTTRLKYFVNQAREAKSDEQASSSRSFSIHLLKKLKNDVQNIEENCGTNIGDSVNLIESSIEILHRRDGKIKTHELAQVEHFTGQLDTEILSDIKACAYHGKN